MLYKNKSFTLTRTVVTSALLLAAAIGVNYLKFYIPIAGTQSVRVALGGPFLRFIGILFGPLWGGMAPAVSDVIGYILKPTGPYFWQLTAVALAKGFSIAFMWHAIKKINFKAFSVCYITIFSALILLGIFNMIYTKMNPESAYTVFFEKRLDYISLGFIICGVAGIAVYAAAKLFLKGKYANHLERFLKLMVSVGIPSVILSTVNTYLLIWLYGWTTPFIIIWIPRLVEQLFEIIYSVSALIIFLSVYERAFGSLDDTSGGI